jgi:shikimate kinase
MTRIFLIGYMGSGKTAMGRLLAKNLHLDFYDLDAWIEKKYHTTIASIFAEKGESYFREIEKNCLRETGEFENVVISTGGGAPCFFDNMQFMNNHGTTIYLKLTPEHLAERLQSTRTGVRPLIAGKSSEELIDFIRENLGKRAAFYEQAKFVITGTDEEITNQINSFQG